MNKLTCILILVLLTGCATEQGQVQKEIPGDVVPKPEIIQDQPTCYDQDNFAVPCDFKSKPKKKRHK